MKLQVLELRIGFMLFFIDLSQHCATHLQKEQAQVAAFYLITTMMMFAWKVSKYLQHTLTKFGASATAVANEEDLRAT